MNPNAKLAPFNWEDPLLIDGQLTEEERMVRDSAHSYPVFADSAQKVR